MPVSDPIVITASGESTSAIITSPNHTDGDQLIAWVSFAGGTGVTITPPAEWTLVSRENHLNQFSLVTYQKTAAAEPTNQTWTLSSSQKWTGGMAAYPGGGTIALNTGRSDQYGVRNFQTAPITTSRADSRVIAIAAQASPSTYTAPTDWIVRGQERSGVSNKRDISSALIDRTQAVAGLVPAATITAAVGTSVLVVSRTNGTSRSSDPSVKPQDALTNLGFTDILIVGHRTAAATMLQQSNDRDVTVILGEVSSGNVGTKLNTSTTGVLNLEIGLFSTLLTASNFVEGAVGGSLRIDVPTHPVANGLSGTVEIAAENRFYYGASPVAPDASLIASIPDEPATNSTWFAIERGGELTDASLAPARQVHCGVHENTVGWTDDSVTLLEGSIDFCARNGPSPQIVVMLELPEAGVVVVNESTGTGAITLPAVDIAGEGTASNVVGQGAVTLPSLEVSGEGTSASAPAADEAVGSGDIALPQIEVSGEGTAINVVGAGAISLPSPTVRGGGTAGIPQEARGSGNVNLPAVSMMGSGAIQDDSIIVPTTNRTLVVEKESRIATVKRESRTFAVNSRALSM